MDLNVILTSVLCSAIVSGVFVFLNAFLDRKARVKELQFKIAFELAHENAKRTLEVAMATQQRAIIADPIYHAESYQKWVKHFYESGKLPPEASEKLKKDKEKLNV